RLIFATGSAARLDHFYRMAPSPLHLGRQISRITRCEVQAGPTVRNKLLHRSEIGAQDWNAASKRFDYCRAEGLVPFAGKNEKPRPFHHPYRVRIWQRTSEYDVRQASLHCFLL